MIQPYKLSSLFFGDILEKGRGIRKAQLPVPRP